MWVLPNLLIKLIRISESIEFENQKKIPSSPKAEKPEKLSKYKHLGKAGSEGRLKATVAVCRRRKIEQHN